MRIRSSLLTIIAALVAAAFLGCATPMTLPLKQHGSPTAVLEPSKGHIYIYREAEFLASARGMYIIANGRRVGGLNNGTYFVYQAYPGEVVIAAENTLDGSETVKRKIVVEPNRNYYLRGSFKSGFWDIKPHIEIMFPAEGEQAIQSLSFETME